VSPELTPLCPNCPVPVIALAVELAHGNPTEKREASIVVNVEVEVLQPKLVPVLLMPPLVRNSSNVTYHFARFDVPSVKLMVPPPLQFVEPVPHGSCTLVFAVVPVASELKAVDAIDGPCCAGADVATALGALATALLHWIVA
jgi:hypothetical protein